MLKYIQLAIIENTGEPAFLVCVGVIVIIIIALVVSFNKKSKAQANPAVRIPSIEERLAILSNLRSKGLIDEQEYSLRRQKIIDEV